MCRTSESTENENLDDSVSPDKEMGVAGVGGGGVTTLNSVMVMVKVGGGGGGWR